MIWVRAVMSIVCFLGLVGAVEDGGVVVVVMMALISVRRSDRIVVSEYMVNSIQKNEGVALTRTPIRSPISKRATSSMVPPLLIRAS